MLQDKPNTDTDTLVDISEVALDLSLPPDERREAFLEQVGNPCRYRFGDMVVEVEYAQTDITLEQCLESYFSLLR